MKILVVDDSSVIRDLVKFTLTRSGHDIFEADDGDTGFQIAKDILPDLILLDIEMPRMNGLETCSAIRTEPLTRNIPIFILSSKGQMDDLEKAFQVGADNYITKPFSTDKLEDTIIYKLAKLKRK